MSFTSLATYGEYSHKLTVDELASHAHKYYSPIVQKVTATSSGSTYGNYNMQYKINSDGAGSDNAHNNIQPSIGVYFWRRTS